MLALLTHQVSVDSGEQRNRLRGICLGGVERTTPGLYHYHQYSYPTTKVNTSTSIVGPWLESILEMFRSAKHLSLAME
jgi:hypothetical protein